MKNLVLVIALISSALVYCQEQLNDYKYIIVPKHFEDFKKPNQYLTSTKIKHILTERGFNVVYDDALPEDLSRNRCLGVKTNLVNGSGMFTTKVELQFLDCSSKEVYKTKQGKSKIKEYNQGYEEAIKNAIKSLDGFTYYYKQKEVEKPLVVSFKNDVKKLEEVKPKNQSKNVTQVATPEEQSYKDVTPQPSMIKKAEPVNLVNTVLYSQEMDYGYQIVDSTPRVVMKLYRTALENIYIVKGNILGGVVYKIDDKWIHEYESEGKTATREVLIKF